MTRTKKTVLMTHQPEHGQDKAQAKGRGRLDAAGGRVLVPRPSAVGHSVKVRGDGKRPKASRFALSRMSAFEALLSCRDAPTGSLCQKLPRASAARRENRRCGDASAAGRVCFRAK